MDPPNAFELELWRENGLMVVSPVDAGLWPSRDPVVSASSLTFSNYFTKLDLPEETLQLFRKFIGSIAMPVLQDGCLEEAIRLTYWDMQRGANTRK